MVAWVNYEWKIKFLLIPRKCKGKWFWLCWAEIQYRTSLDQCCGVDTIEKEIVSIEKL